MERENLPISTNTGSKDPVATSSELPLNALEETVRELRKRVEKLEEGMNSPSQQKETVKKPQQDEKKNDSDTPKQEIPNKGTPDQHRNPITDPSAQQMLREIQELRKIQNALRPKQNPQEKTSPTPSKPTEVKVRPPLETRRKQNPEIQTLNEQQKNEKRKQLIITIAGVVTGGVASVAALSVPGIAVATVGVVLAMEGVYLGDILLKKESLSLLKKRAEQKEKKKKTPDDLQLEQLLDKKIKDIGEIRRYLSYTKNFTRSYIGGFGAGMLLQNWFGDQVTRDAIGNFYKYQQPTYVHPSLQPNFK